MAERKLIAWSYSRWAQYETCPAQCAYKHIDKMPEEKSAAMERGNRLHKMGEAWVKGGGKDPLPDAYRKFSDLMYELVRPGMPPLLCEQEWGMTKEWRPTGWFGKATWLRCKLDLGIVYPDGDCDVIDYKSGREYDSNHEQMELNSLVTMCRYPQVEKVTTRLWYLDHGTERTAEFLQENRTDMIIKWEERVAPMFADRTFLPKPGDQCHRCAFSKSKGGPCKFG